MVGASVTLLGVFLPWGTHISFGPVGAFDLGYGLPIGLWVTVFGLIGLEYVATPIKSTAIVGALFGILTLLLALAYIELGPYGNADYDSTPGSGLFVSLIGSAVLFFGAVLAYMQAKRAAPPVPKYAGY